jgi:signal transduction histidine kinase/CheY-like chemotaxis protein
MKEAKFRNELEYLILLSILFGAYVITARIGLSLYAVNTFATLIWAPTGIAIAAVILQGYRMWPAILLGAFFVNLAIGATPPIAAGIAIGNTLEAVAAFYLLNRIGFKSSDGFANLQTTIGFVVFAAFLATMVSASIGTLVVYLGSGFPPAEILHTWFTWWIGDMLGVIVFTPLITIWISATRAHLSRRRTYEIAVFLVFLVGLNSLAFLSPTGEVAHISLLYLLPIPLIWATLRFGARGKSASIFLTALIVMAATVSGHGPFAAFGFEQGLLLSQAFVGALGIIFLFFAAVVEERFAATEALRHHVDELSRALSRIRSEDQAKTDFLAILAHELRNPLAPVKSALELIRINGIGEENEQYFSIIESQVDNISKLLDDLLDISRISRKKLRLKKETVDLQTHLAHVKAAIEPAIKERRHSLSFIVPQEPLYLVADPLRLEQILINILSNAAKYTDPGGTIVLEVTLRTERVVISVRDTGRGIEPALINKIFEPFVQEQGAEMRSHGRGTGMGIGLFLTKRLVELHGGTIVANSKGPGLGSEFTVELPIPKQAVLPMPTLARSMQPLAAHKRRKVLVVDDNKSAAESIARLLQHRGHETQIAYDGKGTLDVLARYAPEVVILDLGLPDISGYEVAQQIKNNNRRVSLVALTGYGQSEDKEKSSAAGFDHHLIKPVAIADIERVLAVLP